MTSSAFGDEMGLESGQFSWGGRFALAVFVSVYIFRVVFWVISGVRLMGLLFRVLFPGSFRLWMFQLVFFRWFFLLVVSTGVHDEALIILMICADVSCLFLIGVLLIILIILSILVLECDGLITNCFGLLEVMIITGLDCKETELKWGLLIPLFFTLKLQCIHLDKWLWVLLQMSSITVVNFLNSKLYLI